MSFLNKLFGGNPKPKSQAPPPKPKEDSTETKKLKIESSINTLDQNIASLEDREKKLEHKIDVLKKKAKELLEADKKKEAKKYIEEATKLQKQMENFSLRKKIIVDKKFQLEQVGVDMETFDAVDGAQIHLKDQEKLNDKFSDLILDGQEAKLQQNEMNNKLRDLVGNESEDEEVDNMLDDLMAEINADKKKKILTDKNVSVNTPAIQKQTKKAKEEDDIAQMLANLG